MLTLAEETATMTVINIFFPEELKAFIEARMAHAGYAMAGEYFRDHETGTHLVLNSARLNLSKATT